MLKNLLLLLLIIVASFTLSYFLYFNLSYCGVAPWGCPSFSDTIEYNYEVIPTGPGPEDFAVDKSTGQNRLIISCSARRNEGGNGSFYSVKVGESKSQKLQVIPPNTQFQPHGIHIVTIDSIHWLYAISHDVYDSYQKDRIIRFKIEGDTLLFDPLFELIDPLLKIPNDLHVISDGTIYATNYLKSADFSASLLTSFGKKTGDLVYYNGSSWSIALDNLCYPNGVWISDSGTTLVMANGACQEISRYDIIEGIVQANSKRSTRYHDIKIPMGDNLMIDDQGRIWTANHPCTLDFLSHAGDAKNHSSIEIRTIDPNTLKSNVILGHDGSVISAASTALYLDGHLYISQVFDPFIIDIKGAF